MKLPSSVFELMVVVTMVSEVLFEPICLKYVWYRIITKVALIKEKMQNTAIKMRLFFVFEVSIGLIFLSLGGLGLCIFELGSGRAWAWL